MLCITIHSDFAVRMASMIDKIFGLFLKPIIDEAMIDDYRRAVVAISGISI